MCPADRLRESRGVATANGRRSPRTVRGHDQCEDREEIIVFARNRSLTYLHTHVYLYKYTRARDFGTALSMHFAAVIMICDYSCTVIDNKFVVVQCRVLVVGRMFFRRLLILTSFRRANLTAVRPVVSKTLVWRPAAAAAENDQ